MQSPDYNLEALCPSKLSPRMCKHLTFVPSGNSVHQSSSAINNNRKNWWRRKESTEPAGEGFDRFGAGEGCERVQRAAMNASVNTRMCSTRIPAGHHVTHSQPVPSTRGTPDSISDFHSAYGRGVTVLAATPGRSQPNDT